MALPQLSNAIGGLWVFRVSEYLERAVADSLH